MRVPTSSNPAAKPQKAARMSTSREPIRPGRTDGDGSAKVTFRSAKVVVFVLFFPTVSTRG
jgi:hypothetical protein